MRRLSFVFAALAALALLGAKAPPTRFDATVQPEGAQVFIDGKLRGTAPLQLFCCARRQMARRCATTASRSARRRSSRPR